MLTITTLLGIWSTAGAILSLQAAPPAAHELFESLRQVPKGWSKVADPKPSTRLHLRIALQQQNVEQFEQAILDVSTPDHPKYGLHMKRDEIKAMLRPRESAIRSVLDWLSSSGITDDNILNDGDWVNFNVTVEKANEMMDTEFALYRNSINKAERIRTLQYSLPKALHESIVMIQPTTRFGQIRPERSWEINLGLHGAATGVRKWHGVEANIAACNATITPACLQALYNIGGYKADPKSGAKLGIAGYLEQYAKYDALKTFIAEYAPYAVGTNFSVVSINGGLNTQNDTFHNDQEANLDIQYSVSMSYPVSNIYYTTGGRGQLVPDLDQLNLAQNQNEPYLDFLTYMLRLPDGKLPQTLTTSYGEDEQSVPESYTRTVCSMFGQLGARGVSVLFASGDTGVGSACQTNDGKNTTRFMPIFPAACPWVTSVGGTYQVQPERAIAFSAGGFSDRFPRPSYQDKAVKKYLSILGNKWWGLFNPDGRGFPDVAAQSWNFHYIDQGQEGLIGGTSAASPTFAAIVSLLNAARLSARQPPMGFLNPWIYSVGRHGLHDIVDGGSKGCTGTDIYTGLPTPFVPFASWNATEGWDPVTGYGTPNFQYLLKLSTSSAAKAMMRRNFQV